MNTKSKSDPGSQIDSRLLSWLNTYECVKDWHDEEDDVVLYHVSARIGQPEFSLRLPQGSRLIDAGPCNDEGDEIGLVLEVPKDLPKYNPFVLYRFKAAPEGHDLLCAEWWIGERMCDLRVGEWGKFVIAMRKKRVPIWTG